MTSSTSCPSTWQSEVAAAGVSVSATAAGTLAGSAAAGLGILATGATGGLAAVGILAGAAAGAVLGGGAMVTGPGKSGLALTDFLGGDFFESVKKSNIVKEQKVPLFLVSRFP